MPAQTIKDAIAMHSTGPSTWESDHPPSKMGNTLPIAFGGCTLAAAAAVAHQLLPPSYRLFSLMGNFLGPAFTDRPYILSYHEIRRTRSFITRIISVSQRLDNGTIRLCLHATADFHIAEPASMMEFSKPPDRDDYSPPSSAGAVTAAQRRQDLLASNQITPEMAATHEKQFALFSNYFHSYLCLEGVMGQNIMGVAKHIQTSQDELPLTSKTSADWMRSKVPLTSPTENVASVAFILDAGLAFVALSHSGQFLDDAEACSTLDFALRVLDNDVDLNGWHVREMKAIAGGSARTYSEVQLWDQKRGKMVASMTQTSILRPKKGQAGKL